MSDWYEQELLKENTELKAELAEARRSAGLAIGERDEIIAELSKARMENVFTYGTSHPDAYDLGVVVPREFVLFLLGEAEHNGMGMGDYVEEVCGGKFKARYGWRKELRQHLKAAEEQGDE